MANPIKAVKAAKKAAQRAETNKIQKNSVKVKPAAKQKPNRPNEAKAMYKYRNSRGRAYNSATREYEEEFSRHGNWYEMQEIGQDALLSAKSTRKTNIAEKKLVQAERRKATTPKNQSTNYNPWVESIKIKSSIPKKRGK